MKKLLSTKENDLQVYKYVTHIARLARLFTLISHGANRQIPRSHYLYRTFVFRNKLRVGRQIQVNRNDSRYALAETRNGVTHRPIFSDQYAVLKVCNLLLSASVAATNFRAKSLSHRNQLRYVRLFRSLISPPPPPRPFL